MQSGAQPKLACPGLSIDDFGHVRERPLRRLIVHWLAVRGHRSMPARTDIDPIDVPWALSRLWLCDYEPAVDKFRYRIAGEDINRVFGYNLARHYLDDVVAADKREAIREKYQRIRTGPCIMHDIGQVYLSDDRPAIGERIVLPLASMGTAVDAIVGATIYRINVDRTESRRWAGRHDTVFTPI